MGKKSDLKDEDLIEIYDTAWSQLKEDREMVLDMYHNLYGLISGSAERYAVSGDTLAKFGDLAVKQTSQLIELMKIAQKQKEKDSSLSPEDFEHISKALSSDE